MTGRVTCAACGRNMTFHFSTWGRTRTETLRRLGWHRLPWRKGERPTEWLCPKGGRLASGRMS